ncbi:GntR family transcriptional regulator [Streptomyces tubbatahanensis]|uniref:GntR family transcriptional regulator n=1 Tax=Streptomyces tubbatahanensis TaxID=2923272 RepID=A0ABY3XYC2_9ACTN|nr:GntR family transcriptional regulator [Streptomyces tubbatahanensis]UNS99238.1 GntR family transcriptional regulator [Streptomyces tubbatahanensis]
MPAARSSARSLYAQVADLLRKEIKDNQYAPDQPLPREEDLVKKHGVSRDTVRKALAQLTQEGLIYSTGRSRYVRLYSPLEWSLHRFEHSSGRSDEGSEALDAWSRAVVDQGRKPRQDVEVSMRKPPPEVAAGLEVDANEFVVVRQRTRYVDEVPYQLSTSYFPHDVAEGTPLMEEGDVSAKGGILAASGYPQKRYLDRIKSRMPMHDEAERLGLPQGTAVIEHTRIGYGEDDRPLRMMVTIAPGDRHTLVYEVPAA